MQRELDEEWKRQHPSRNPKKWDDETLAVMSLLLRKIDQLQKRIDQLERHRRRNEAA